MAQMMRGKDTTPPTDGHNFLTLLTTLRKNFLKILAFKNGVIKKYWTYPNI